MAIRITILFLMISFSAVSQKNTFPIEMPSSENTVKKTDSINYVFFKDSKNEKDTFLTPKESNLIQTLLKNKIAKFGNKGYQFEDYRMQMGVWHKKHGKKTVWINGFCESKVDWRKQFFLIFDGGDCYFRAEINLKKQKLTYFHFNGEG